MILIIEGPDGAGKTTLARAMAGRKADEYHHEGPPPPGSGYVYSYYWDKLREASAGRQPFQTIVFDRFAVGETIYGPALRGGSRLGISAGRFIVHARSFGALHLLCLPPYAKCLYHWDARRSLGHELIQDRATFTETYNAWRAIAPQFDLVYDYTSKGSAE